MDVKEAVSVAKSYLADVLSEEDVTNVGLEEIEFDDSDSTWKITLGFSRPWDYQRARSWQTERRPPARSYKILRVADGTGRIESIRDRFTADQLS